MKKGMGKVAKVMHEFKEKTLRSSAGPKVTNPKMAIAIGLSEARRAGATVPQKSNLPGLGATQGTSSAEMRRQAIEKAKKTPRTSAQRISDLGAQQRKMAGERPTVRIASAEQRLRGKRF